MVLVRINFYLCGRIKVTGSVGGVATGRATVTVPGSAMLHQCRAGRSFAAGAGRGDDEAAAGGSASGAPGRLTGVPGPGAGPTEIRSGIHGIRRGPAKKNVATEGIFLLLQLPPEEKLCF